MLADQFTLPEPDADARKMTTAWLFLGLASLVIAGLFTILIVLSRTPYFQEIIPWVDFFRTALVVHVDLTVLVWFLAFAGVLWSYNSSNRYPRTGWLALLLSAAGTLIITISPFTGESYPLMNNYVPVLQSTVFFIGLGTFGLGFSLLVVRTFLASWTIGTRIGGVDALRFGLLVAAIAALLAIVALVLSYFDIDEGFVGQAYYDRLFWGSGHIIQFTHTQLMLVAWLWLASVSGAYLRVSPRIALILFALGMAPLVMVPIIYFRFEVSSGGHLFWFIQLMKYGGALAAVPIGLATTLSVIEKWRPTPGFEVERNTLLFSILLFGVGGIIGFMITGSNVTVPAHYHGSIVGVTLAFMGITYHILPRLGFRKVSGRAARWQPGIYGSGQLMHIIGLAWSGGYGVQRKTAGSEQGLEQFEQVAGMSLMGFGGLISIIGGVMFLVIVYLAIRPVKDQL
ncbi:MAG: cbb3-type cytochrome c oxidase subunit I [Thiotrichales bacterium]|nr:MAG: cbb3-type cytochrome c oxidase subunit I [Thiotrichales bacterium]